MPKTIAIGSINPSKVNAVRRAALLVWPDVTLLPVAVESGVSVMPMSDEEGMRGALQRARRARELADADLGVGLEGSVADSTCGMYLTGWVAIVDRDGHTGLASGGRLPLPQRIAEEVRQGAELGPIIDRYSGHVNSKEQMGAAGYLTNGLVLRDTAFEIAVAYALAPFLHPELYETDDR